MALPEETQQKQKNDWHAIINEIYGTNAICSRGRRRRRHLSGGLLLLRLPLPLGECQLCGTHSTMFQRSLLLWFWSPKMSAPPLPLAEAGRMNESLAATLSIFCSFSLVVVDAKRW